LKPSIAALGVGGIQQHKRTEFRIDIAVIAVNLAIFRATTGREVLLVDGDEQGSAALFSQLRADLVGTCGYTAVELHGSALRTQVRQLAEHGLADAALRLV
jgi:cellulose biosynthesis protein BcsQ